MKNYLCATVVMLLVVLYRSQLVASQNSTRQLSYEQRAKMMSNIPAEAKREAYKKMPKEERDKVKKALSNMTKEAKKDLSDLSNLALAKMMMLMEAKDQMKFFKKLNETRHEPVKNILRDMLHNLEQMEKALDVDALDDEWKDRFGGMPGMGGGDYPGMGGMPGMGGGDYPGMGGGDYPGMGGGDYPGMGGMPEGFEKMPFDMESIFDEQKGFFEMPPDMKREMEAKMPTQQSADYEEKLLPKPDGYKCGYGKGGKWGVCDPVTLTKNRTRPLKKGWDIYCKRSEIETRPCSIKDPNAPNCMYDKNADWAPCDPQTKKVTKRMQLSPNSDQQCEPTKEEHKRCITSSKKCKYGKANWGDCEDGTKTMVMRIDQAASDPACLPEKIKAKGCNSRRSSRS